MILQELIVLRAIRDANVPKFLQEDLKLFNGIVSDLFPKIKEASHTHTTTTTTTTRFDGVYKLIKTFAKNSASIELYFWWFYVYRMYVQCFCYCTTSS